MRDVPFGVPESSHPETLHVENRPGIYQKLSIVGLGDGSLGVPEQDRRGLFHWKQSIVVFWIELEAHWVGDDRSS